MEEKVYIFKDINDQVYGIEATNALQATNRLLKVLEIEFVEVISKKENKKKYKMKTGVN